MTLSDVAQLGVLALSAIAIVLSLRGVSDQLWLQTFSVYTGRYLDVLEALPPSATLGTHSSVADASPQDQAAMLVVMRRYMNLCSEEYYLHSRRRIDKSTWGVWLDGMRRTMGVPAFREAWRVVGEEYAYFPSFHGFMTAIVRDAGPAVSPTPG